jgi:hypothetical protein
MPLSPAVVLLFKMPWNRKFPAASPNSKSKFPHWYSSALRYYIRKNNNFYRRLKKKRNPTVFIKIFLSILS